MKNATFAARLALVLLLVACRGVEGQGWTLDAYGGRVANDRADATGRSTATVGVRYQDEAVGWLYVSSGLPLGSSDSAWGALGMGRRWVEALGELDVGLDSALHGYLYRDPSSSTGSGGTLDLRPFVGIGLGSLRFEARSGWLHSRARIASETTSRGIHDSDARGRVTIGRTARVGTTLRHVRAAEGSYTFGGGEVTIGVGPVSAWGSLGAWDSAKLPTTQWGAGLSVRVDEAGGTRVGLSFRQDAADPLYWSPPAQRWRIGVSHDLGTLGREATGTEAAGDLAPVVVSPGRVTIRLTASESQEQGTPSIGGDFTGWGAIPMTWRDGHWTAELELGPGVYRYAFRSASGEWFVPTSQPTRRPDGMGGFVATLIVRN